MSARVKSSTKWLVTLGVGLIVLGAAVFHNQWVPPLRKLLASDGSVSSDNSADEGSDTSHGDDPHAHPPTDHPHDEATALPVSPNAAMAGDLVAVKLQKFARNISVPAQVVLRPGRSRIRVTAPFTGRVTRIHCIEGEAVKPGTELFELELTHEELVDAQADFLRIAEEIVVIDREIARLAEVVQGGAIAGKTLLEREYEKQKSEAALHAQRQRLYLHGLSKGQVETILNTRELLQHLTVLAPELPDDKVDNPEKLMQIVHLDVEQGQHVTMGTSLAVLADHSELYIEGQAFEQDISSITDATVSNWRVTAIFPSAANGDREVCDLTVLRLADEIDPQSRTLHFYVTLPNPIVRDMTNDTGQRFINREYKPGQRLRLKVPIERAIGRIVLPADAVVQDGTETCVYEYVKDHFDRRVGQEEYRDQDKVMIANDGSLRANAQVAVSGAYQVHLAIKNKGQPESVNDHGHAH